MEKKTEQICRIWNTILYTNMMNMFFHYCGIVDPGQASLCHAVGKYSLIFQTRDKVKRQLHSLLSPGTVTKH